MSKKNSVTNFGNMSKKTAKRVLIAFGAGAVLLLGYLYFTGTFSSGRVFADPEKVADAHGDPKQTAINYNATAYKIVTAGDDVCIAPMLVAADIGLYSEGATGEGKEQAYTILNSENDVKENHAALVNALGKPFEESSFNGLFMDKRTNPKAEFVAANDFYGTYFETVDFFDFVKMRDRINEIAAEKTGGKINKAIETVQLNSSMLFVSGYRFREYFGDKVGSVSYVKGEFLGNETEICQIEQAKVKLFKNDSVTFLSIPLDNGFEYEMLMFGGDFKNITMADIKSYRENAKETIASVSMPAPKYSGVGELKPALKNAGFDVPFSKDSLIGGITRSMKSKIDKIDQSVDFEILYKNGAQGVREKATESVVIDKPFVYMVSDGQTGCKVIMGKRSK